MALFSKCGSCFVTGLLAGVALMGAFAFTAPHRASSGVYGDVNGDGEVDVRDINEIINIILEIPKGDPTQDGAVTTYSVNGVEFSMVAVKGGTFMMGGTAEQGDDAEDDEFPVHPVTLSDYSIGQTEVTQRLWRAVMGANPSAFTGDLSCPVERVSWNDSQTFIAKLNEMTGKSFRLPTEAEWEFAARGGNKSRGYKYSGSDDIDEVAWYSANASSKTHPVGTKKKNELGLYDMSGNVLEWCQDWYGAYTYSSTSVLNPTGSSSGSLRVYRGGGWSNSATHCRVSDRSGNSPSVTSHNLGLRLAL